MSEDEKKSVFLIKGGTLIDGTGAKPLKDCDVLIEGKNIKSVGKNIAVSNEAKIINAKGKTVMPGLIDSHIHFWGGLAGGMMEWLMRPPELVLIKSVFDAKAFLNAGYTTVKCCGSMAGLYVRDSSKEGTLKGVPRIIAAGPWISQTFGHGDQHNLPTEYVDVRSSRHPSMFTSSLLADGIDECIKATRYAMRMGADFIKIHVSGGFISLKDKPTDIQFNLNEIKAIVDTAAQAGKYVTAHYQISIPALRNAILGGVKTIDHALLTDDSSVEMAVKKGVIFVSTISVFRKSLELGNTNAKMIIESYNRIHKAGAVFAIGSDNMCIGNSPANNAAELELLIKYCDITPMESIVMTTKNGAQACFIGDRTGTIEAGKLADIIIVNGDPLADIKVLQDADKIEMVMLEGNIEKHIK